MKFNVNTHFLTEVIFLKTEFCDGEDEETLEK